MSLRYEYARVPLLLSNSVSSFYEVEYSTLNYTLLSSDITILAGHPNKLFFPKQQSRVCIHLTQNRIVKL